MKKIINAFTLIELLVVITIIGVLATISVASFNNYMVSARVAVVKNVVGDLYRATVVYAQAEDLPYSSITLSELVNEFDMTAPPEYMNVIYVASGDDFYYQAQLPNGEEWTVALIPKVYAENSNYYVKGTSVAIDYFKALTEAERSSISEAAENESLASSLVSGASGEEFDFEVITSPWEEEVEPVIPPPINPPISPL